jgi:biofilm PGA synthesis N-glycosyltransferase PgaC
VSDLILSEIVTELWFTLLIMFFGSYLSYFVYLKRKSTAPWKLNIDSTFMPPVTILLPAHNEEKFIQLKLENLKEVDYPEEKMEVIFIDDASTDRTLEIVEKFKHENPDLDLKILPQPKRRGKANGLNVALKKYTRNNLVVVTDADTFWPKNILSRVLPYMSDETVGAISGVAESKGDIRSWVADAEKNYLSLMFFWRLGESKIYSTLRFEGCFCVFRRTAFEEFDSKSGADDSGTALEVIQNGYRAILVPEGHMQVFMPTLFWARASGKIRRAVHLTGLWVLCLKLMIKGQLKLPVKIALPEVILSLFMPFVFVAITIFTIPLLYFDPVPMSIFLIALCSICVYPKARSIIVQSISDQFILAYAVLLYVANKRYVTWNH